MKHRPRLYSPHFDQARGITVKNWTLRQRILASFAVIIAIMLLMVVVSYSRLLKIEASEVSVRDDALPGVYYSSMIRGAWVDSYLQTQEMLGLKEGQGISAEDAADFKSFEARVQDAMSSYRATVTTDEDSPGKFTKIAVVEPPYCAP